jgi:predicted phosphodiesterase
MDINLVLPDLHFPFAHKSALEHIERIAWREGATTFTGIGDIIDHHAASRFRTEPDAMTAQEEYEKTMEMLEPWKKRFPQMTLVTGNHDIIPQRRAKELDLAHVHHPASIEEAYEFPKGWKVVRNLVKDGVYYVHSAGGGKYAAVNKAKEEGMSVVAGHTHRHGGVIYYDTPQRTFFGLQTGCLIDPDSYAMRYSSLYEKPRVSLGCAVVYSAEEAYYCPMNGNLK